MGISLSEIVERATQIATGRGVDPFKNPVVDAGMTTETLFPHALQFTIRQGLTNGQNLSNVARIHELNLDNGSVALPDGVMEEFLKYSSLPQYGKKASWVPPSRYVGTRYDTMLCYFTAINGKLLSNCAAKTIEHDLIRVCEGIVQDLGGGTAVVFTNADGDLTADDEGRRAVILQTAGGDNSHALVDTTIDVVTDSDNFTIVDAPAAPFSAAVLKIYEPTTSGLQLLAPTIPETPDDIDEEMDLPKAIANDTIATLAFALTGQISLKDILFVSK